MAHKCEKCGWFTIFFMWSTSRIFNRDKFVEVMNPKNDMERLKLLNGTYTVCLGCVDKYGLSMRY